MNRRTFLKTTGILSVSPLLFAKKESKGINIEESQTNFLNYSSN
jgi:hypothetical protein